MNLEDLLNNQPSDEDGQSSAESSPLQSLKVDLDFYSDSIKEVSTEMIIEGYTLYPIFIAHQHEVRIGEVLLDKSDLGTNWSINVSSVEEFVDRGIIKEEKRAYFEKHFKKAENFMCLFVVVPEGANFVFYPYK
ncbi:hypothetical protein FAZ15_10635 [Sphingobacterium olei]|uniref:Uncharacterized protein n=1 Tax=Sphingobacterium olei TaxID=2571155 RepID=A0A4U0NZU7_9SPHI|nr:hypothetical protein [Sphingobacterium olei]TJZ60451.1 hypothetical protein FAZ15_10635 [Sphingobacterium olei]